MKMFIWCVYEYQEVRVTNTSLVKAILSALESDDLDEREKTWIASNRPDKVIDLPNVENVHFD